jgi:hypothetical protein
MARPVGALAIHRPPPDRLAVRRPACGVGSRATVTAALTGAEPGMSIEVVEAETPAPLLRRCPNPPRAALMSIGRALTARGREPLVSH